MSTIQVRVDDQTKNRVDRLFTSLGLDTSTAIRIFFQAALEAEGLPFEVRHSKPNAETLAALRETEEIISGKKAAVRYGSVREAFDAALAEDD